MTRLLLATTNPHKQQEIRRVLAGTGVDVLDLSAVPGIPAPVEDGATFQENARLKALHYAQHAAPRVPGGPAGVLVAAEDSGLVIDALGGEPGVHSARFLRPDATYPERFAEIARRLALVPGAPRRARFVCALAVAENGRIVFETTGTIEGEIDPTPRGTHGFGYDPIFVYPPYGATLAEVDEDAKLRVAHRGQAFRALNEWLRERGSGEGGREARVR